jgi:hypothetical protein
MDYYREARLVVWMNADGWMLSDTTTVGEVGKFVAHLLSAPRPVQWHMVYRLIDGAQNFYIDARTHTGRNDWSRWRRTINQAAIEPVP